MWNNVTLSQCICDCVPGQWVSHVCRCSLWVSMSESPSSSAGLCALPRLSTPGLPPTGCTFVVVFHRDLVSLGGFAPSPSHFTRAAIVRGCVWDGDVGSRCHGGPSGVVLGVPGPGVPSPRGAPVTVGSSSVRVVLPRNRRAGPTPSRPARGVVSPTGSGPQGGGTAGRAQEWTVDRGRPSLGEAPAGPPWRPASTR